MRTIALSLFAVSAALAACNTEATAPHEQDQSNFPAVIQLPKGFAPEGMAFGGGTTVYVGSLLTGDIWRGDVSTGVGQVMVTGKPGQSATGIKYDERSNYIFVAGGFTGQAYVYDAASGASIAELQLASMDAAMAGQTLVNDVVIMKDAAYFTDSFQPVLYRVPLAANGKVAGAPTVVPLSGSYTLLQGGAFNGTGIAATPDGKQLILMNSEEGVLYLVNPASGNATKIATDKSLSFGDGIILDGRRLYVVQAAPDQVNVVDFNASYTAGTVTRAITDSKFAFPTAVGELGASLWVLNGRFDVAPPGMPAPGIEFQLVRVAH